MDGWCASDMDERYRTFRTPVRKPVENCLPHFRPRPGRERARRAPSPGAPCPREGGVRGTGSRQGGRPELARGEKADLPTVPPRPRSEGRSTVPRRGEDVIRWPPQADRASTKGRTEAAPATRSSRPATVIVHRESARSSTSNT